MVNASLIGALVRALKVSPTIAAGIAEEILARAADGECHGDLRAEYGLADDVDLAPRGRVKRVAA